MEAFTKAGNDTSVDELREVRLISHVGVLYGVTRTRKRVLLIRARPGALASGPSSALRLVRRASRSTLEIGFSILRV